MRNFALLAVASLFLTTLAQAGTLVYGLKSTGVLGGASVQPTRLFSFDGTTGVVNDIAWITYAGAQGDADGLCTDGNKLYAFMLSPNGSALVQINPSTAAANQVAFYPGTAMRGATIRNGTIYALDVIANTQWNLAKINLATTGLVSTGLDTKISDACDLDFDASGTLWVAEANAFHTLNPGTGAVTFVAADQVLEQTQNFVFNCGFVFDETQPGRSLTLDVDAFDDLYVYGMPSPLRTGLTPNILPYFNAGRGDLAAVPEPKTWLALAAGAWFFSRRRKHRRTSSSPKSNVQVSPRFAISPLIILALMGGLAPVASLGAYEDFKPFNARIFTGAAPPTALWTYRAGAIAATKDAVVNEFKSKDWLPVATPSNATVTALADLSPHAWAKSESWYSLDTVPTPPRLIGEIGIRGDEYSIPPEGIGAWAGSYSEMGWGMILGRNKDGTLKLAGGNKKGYHHIGHIVGSTTTNTVLKDPIDFRFWDPVTGDTILTDRLFEMDMSLSGLGAGNITWDGDMLFVNSPTGHGSLFISFGSAYTDIRGTLNLEFADGTITTSTTSGIFAGTLPATGTPANFAALIGGSQEMTYDYSAKIPDNVNATLKISTEASEAVPEPASLVAMAAALGMLAVRRRIA